jgi:hypothetical protein
MVIRRKGMMIEIVYLILGIALDHLWNNYIYPLYFKPYSYLRILYNDSSVTIDNIGKITVERTSITIRVNNPNSMIKAFRVIENLDVRKPEPYAVVITFGF